MSLRKRLLQSMVHDRSDPAGTSAIQSVSRRRSDRNYALAARYVRNRRVLDIGPGYGFGYEHLLARNPDEIVCMDYFSDAQSKFLHNDERVSFVVGDFLDNDFEDASFDTILCIATIYYFQDHARFLAQVKRLLKPGGRLVINHFDGDLIRRFFGAELTDLDPRYGRMFGGSEFAGLLEDTFGTRPRHYVQSPVRVGNPLTFLASSATLPLRLLLGEPALLPHRPGLKGIYNYFIVRNEIAEHEPMIPQAISEAVEVPA